jgi:hypothetical protein
VLDKFPNESKELENKTKMRKIEATHSENTHISSLDCVISLSNKSCLPNVYFVLFLNSFFKKEKKIQQIDIFLEYTYNLNYIDTKETPTWEIQVHRLSFSQASTGWLP